MATSNILQQVITYQESELAFLQNLGVFISIANKKFENFQNITTNLGSSVDMELPYRFTTADGLVAVNQAITQRVHKLTVDQSANTSMAVTNPEQLFNLDKDQYMAKIGKAAVKALGAKIEKNIALNIISDVPVMIPDPLDNSHYIPTGQYHTESGPCRFYGDGTAGVITPLNSYQQLDQMVQNFVEIGTVAEGMKVVLPNTIIPAIIGSGLNQFAPERNNDIAMSWEVGSFGTPRVDYYKSNLLPTHISGSVGNGATLGVQTLTVVSTNDPTGQNVTQITCTCDGSLSGDPDAIKRGDVAQFIDTPGLPNARALTFQGQSLTSQLVQFRITADAAASGTTVVLNVMTGNGATVGSPQGIVTAPGATQNMNVPIQAGMKIKVMPSHKAGLLLAGDAFFLAMPRLPDQRPFDTASEYDDVSGVSLRLTYGAVLGKNLQQLVHDCIWASTLVPEYCQRILLPM